MEGDVGNSAGNCRGSGSVIDSEGVHCDNSQKCAGNRQNPM